MLFCRDTFGRLTGRDFSPAFFYFRIETVITQRFNGRLADRLSHFGHQPVGSKAPVLLPGR